MLNPDGAILGNLRTSLLGKDLNRVYQLSLNSQNLQLCPEINAVREQLLLSANRSGLFAFFDIHQHSSRKSIFLYGPYFPLHSRSYLSIRLLPKLLSENSQFFRYHSCRYRFDPSKAGSARLAINRMHGLEMSYTIEISAMGYLKDDGGERVTERFDEDALALFGRQLGEAIAEMKLVEEKDRREKEELAKELKRKRRKGKRKELNKTTLEVVARQNIRN